MGRVRLEVLPWLSAACGHRGTGHLLLEEEIGEDETVGEILKRVSAKHRALGECVFDKTTETIHGYISVVHNSQIVPQLKALEIHLKDGDTIRLLPTVDGG